MKSDAIYVARSHEGFNEPPWSLVNACGETILTGVVYDGDVMIYLREDLHLTPDVITRVFHARSGTCGYIERALLSTR